MAEPHPMPTTAADQHELAVPWTKAIPADRDRRQSQALTAVLSVALLIALLHLVHAGWQSHTLTPFPLAISVLFALTVWRLRSATAPAAAIGVVICLLLATPIASHASPSALSPALWPLVLLFLLTFAATRFKRPSKQAGGLAEPRHGRRASQIVANLGVAGLCAAVGFYPGILAALAEATADTVSSEIGQALGGPTRLLTTLRPVSPGTDGGISLRGTAAGIGAAALIVLAGIRALPSWHIAAAIAASSIAGLLFDSLLGATVERRGLLGNDLVNVSSTGASVLIVWSLLRI